MANVIVDSKFVVGDVRHIDHVGRSLASARTIIVKLDGWIGRAASPILSIWQRSAISKVKSAWQVPRHCIGSTFLSGRFRLWKLSKQSRLASSLQRVVTDTADVVFPIRPCLKGSIHLTTLRRDSPYRTRSVNMQVEHDVTAFLSD